MWYMWYCHRMTFVENTFVYMPIRFISSWLSDHFAHVIWFGTHLVCHSPALVPHSFRMWELHEIVPWASIEKEFQSNIEMLNYPNRVKAAATHEHMWHVIKINVILLAIFWLKGNNVFLCMNTVSYIPFFSRFVSKTKNKLGLIHSIIYFLRPNG